MKLIARIATLAGASAFAGCVLAPTAQADRVPPVPTPISRVASDDRFERLQLACRETDGNKVRCEWRAPTGSNAVKVVLYGSVNNRSRIVLTTLRPPAAGSYSRGIPRGARQLEFVLITFNSVGQVVGRSSVLTIDV